MPNDSETDKARSGSVQPDGSASPVTDDAWDAYNRQACGLHYIAHKMREMETRLRGLLENSVVMESTRDDVTICVTKEAYDNAYATAYPPNAADQAQPPREPKP